MKKITSIILAAALALSVFSCRKKGEQNQEALKMQQIEAQLFKDTTQIQYLDSASFAFDTINQGDKVEHSFRLKNVGDKNFIIARAFGSCGCTVPDYPKDPIKPGEIATIHVTFNSAGKMNLQNKTVTVVCNTAKRNEMMYLTGFVRAK